MENNNEEKTTELEVLRLILLAQLNGYGVDTHVPDVETRERIEKALGCEIKWGFSL